MTPDIDMSRRILSPLCRAVLRHATIRKSSCAPRYVMSDVDRDTIACLLYDYVTPARYAPCDDMPMPSFFSCRYYYYTMMMMSL